MSNDEIEKNSNKKILKKNRSQIGLIFKTCDLGHENKIIL